MNVNKLRGLMMIHGDTAADLADALGMSRQSFYNKTGFLSANRLSEFNRNEIQVIIDRYDLSTEDIMDIFFKKGDDADETNNGGSSS